VATSISVNTPGDGTPRTVTYTFPAPGGTIDATDNGTYSVNVVASQVSDTSSNFVPASFLGTFSIAVPTTFTVTNTSDGPVTAKGQLPGSLRQAIFDANANVGADSIVFDTAGVFATPQTISLTAGELAITDSVMITGTGNNK